MSPLATWSTDDVRPATRHRPSTSPRSRSAPTTETELADLLLAPIEDVRGALDHAGRTGLITVDGDRSGSFRLTVPEDSHR